MRHFKKFLAALGAVLVTFVVFELERHDSQIEERILKPIPVLVRADYDDGVYNDGARLVIPSRKASRALLHATRCQSLLSAARAEGAVHISPLRLRLVLEGNTIKGVTITGIEARVMDRSRPLRGALTTCPGGAEVTVPQISFNLDSSDPVARVTGSRTPYFANHDIDLAKGERQGLTITATTRRYDVRWKLVLDAVVQGQRREITFGLGARPFRVTAGRCDTRAYSPYFNLDIDHGMLTQAHGSGC